MWGGDGAIQWATISPLPQPLTACQTRLCDQNSRAFKQPKQDFFCYVKMGPVLGIRNRWADGQKTDWGSLECFSRNCNNQIWDKGCAVFLNLFLCARNSSVADHARLHLISFTERLCHQFKGLRVKVNERKKICISFSIADTWTYVSPLQGWVFALTYSPEWHWTHKQTKVDQWIQGQHIRHLASVEISTF